MLQIFRVFTLGMAGLVAAVSPAKPVPVHHFSPPAVFSTSERIDADQQVRLLQEQQAVELIHQQQEAEAARAAEEQRAREEAAAAAQQAAVVAQSQRVAAPVQGPVPAAPPVQAPPPGNYGGGAVQDIIRAAFAPYGPGAVEWGLRVARCESGYNPRAVNGAGPYYGLFQFLTSTFRATPYGGGDIFDAATNARAAAWKFANGGANAWGCN